MANVPPTGSDPTCASGDPLSPTGQTGHEKASIPPKSGRKASSKSSRKDEQAALRRHKAIEKQVRRAELRSTDRDSSSTTARPTIGRMSPDLAGESPAHSIDNSPSPTPHRPAATPSQVEGLADMVNDLKSSILSAITQGLAALQPAQPHRSSSISQASDHQMAADLPDSDLWPSRSQISSHHESDSEAEEGELIEGTFSEDETPLPEVQTAPGLFPPALFRSLLYKAKATANLGEAPTSSQDKDTTTGAPNPLFTTPPTRADEVPTPQIVLDSIQKQWLKPSSQVAPSASEKKFYLPGKALNDLLQPQAVEDPVVSLLSATPVSGDPSDLLKPEDKKLESVMKYEHLSASWAIKAASAATFFNRTSLMWLRQLQERLSSTDVRLHQDVSKIIAATQFSADATLDAIRFSARTMGASATGRRLLWLRNWQAEAKAKWRLASGPLQGDKLFGTALDPLLIETKDKRKILPSHAKRSSRRFTPYSKSQPFRHHPSSSSAPSPAPAQSFQYQPRPFSRRPDRSQDFRDRYRQFPQSKRPFRGASSRPARRQR